MSLSPGRYAWPAIGPVQRFFRWLESSISHRITAAALVLTLAVSLAIGSVSFLMSRGLIENRISQELASEAELAGRQMEFALNTLVVDLSGLASNAMLGNSFADSLGRDAYLAPFLRDYSAPIGVDTTLTLYDFLGRPIAGTAEKPRSYERAPWLAQVIDGGRAHSEIVRGADGRHRLVMARPVVYPSTGLIEGALVMETHLDDAFIKATSFLKSDLGRCLKDERGETLVQAGPLQHDDLVTVTHPIEFSSLLLPYQLRIEISGERARILAPLYRTAYAYAGFAIFILPVVVWSSRKIGERLTVGLSQLSAAAGSVSAGNNEDIPLPVSGRDEVARLTAAFNTMIGKIRESHRELERRVVERTVKLHAINSALEREILGRRRTEEQLRVAANAIESAAEGIIICDLDQKIVSVNRAFTAITGYQPEDVLGQTPEILCSEEQTPAGLIDTARTVRAQGHWKGELWSRKKSGENYLEERSVSSIQDGRGTITNFVIVFSDITKHKKDEQHLAFLAHHDLLTHLPNRTFFQQKCEEALQRAVRHKAQCAVMFIDLDHFKIINDSLGHAAGDELLRGVAGRLQKSVRKTDTVARFGGDEFAVLLDDIREAEDAAFVAGKILERLSASFLVSGHEIYVSASLGISCFPLDGQDALALIKNSDAAMYVAKDHGGNNYRFFSAEMHSMALEALMMASSLRLAIERSEFFLDYQPRFDLRSGRTTGVEALVRWRHPDRGTVMPGQFIGIAEKTGLIERLGEWVVESACAQMMAWRAAGTAPPRMAVNLSARQFKQPDLIERISSILKATGLEAGALELELTESMVMQDPQRAAVTLERLKQMGVSIAIDDFGTGYSSLNYLKRFPIDYIKIDQSFVRGVPMDAEDAGITRAIIAIGKTLGLKLIAEGIETTEQLKFLEDAGCDEGQGFLISRPLAPEKIGEFMQCESRS